MNTKHKIVLNILLFLTFGLKSYSFSSNIILGDTTPCLIEFELEQLENGEFLVSMIPDTTWQFPNNVVSSAQITLKVPTGQFKVGTIHNFIEGVIFFEIGIDSMPIEAPNFDYISFGLGSQTSNIPFQKGVKVNLFSFSNIQTCSNGVISLMDNYTDPFIFPNEFNANVGQQITAAGFNLADVPIAIKGQGISCRALDFGIQIAKQDVSCAGLMNGLIVAKGYGGIAPYSYLWNTGDTLSTLENLDKGTYSLTLTDASGEKVTTSAQIDSPDSLFLEISTVDASSDQISDGKATPFISGGTPPYQFNWSNNSQDSLQTNLSVGNYSLQIIDDNGCQIEQSFTISSRNCPTIDVMLDMQTPNCLGDSTGSLRITALSGLAPFTYLWGTGDTTANLDNISSGNYMVTVTDANGCSMAVSTLLMDANPITISLNPDGGEGLGQGSISATVSGGMMPYAYLWSNGSNETMISNLDPGVYELSITDANGCLETASTVISLSCDLGILDEIGQRLVLDSIDCVTNRNGQLCLPVPLDSMVNYNLFLNGVNYMDEMAGCRYDTFYAYTYFTLPGGGDMGPYVLDEWVINGVQYAGAFQNIQALVDSMNIWDVLGEWAIDLEILIIEGGYPANKYGEMTIRTPIISSLTTLDLNTNLTPTGTLITFEAGEHELILVNNTTTCADTLTINLPCLNNNNSEKDTVLIVNILEGDSHTLNLIEIFGNELSISENQCPIQSDGNATAIVDSSNFDIQIEGILEGTDQFCYTITTSDEEIINVTIQINVMAKVDVTCASFIEIDTFLEQIPDCQNFEICVPILYDSLINYSITDNGDIFSGVNSDCNNGEGSLLNFSTAKSHQLIFTNSKNCKDSLLVVINAPACDEDLVIIDTIEVNDMGQSCIEFEGLSSPFQSVRDLCPEKNGEMVILTIDGITGCIDYSGIELGTDTACIEVCNVYGFCDTISLIIIVTSGDVISPDFEAVDDTIRTSLNEATVLNALGNDIFPTLDDMYLVSMPDNGIATFNLDGTIRYEPVTDYCNDTIPDTFQYAICNANICDTATVTVYIDCRIDKEFTIYNAMSPNGDGINDVFQIDGIENFPNNKILIFNRWGNMVYEMEGYKNEWNGSWGKQGDLLPDGTYFYLFETGDGGSFSGYLEIRR